MHALTGTSHTYTCIHTNMCICTCIYYKCTQYFCFLYNGCSFIYSTFTHVTFTRLWQMSELLAVSLFWEQSLRHSSRPVNTFSVLSLGHWPLQFTVQSLSLAKTEGSEVRVSSSMLLALNNRGGHLCNLMSGSFVQLVAVLQVRLWEGIWHTH